MPENFSRQQEKELERLSPFQLKNRLVDLAETNHERMMLNAGRGNPNWTAIAPRRAFFTLGQFALNESQRNFDAPGMGGHIAGDGILARFEKFAADCPDEVGAEFLQKSLDYVSNEIGLDAGDFLTEMCSAILASHYPTPDRMLKMPQEVVRKYLDQEMCANEPPEGKFDLFAVEGGTAAMCYIFNTLSENKLVNKGDKIALGTPIFSPYLEIPHLNDYELIELEIAADEFNNWQVPMEELRKLEDPEVKAFFLVNPGNPSSVSMDQSSLDYLAELVATKRKDLILLTDDVYGTFVNGFKSLMSIAPKNTICVYSYSKYVGATGWRLGVIAMHEDNVFDQAIANLPQAETQALEERYGSVTLNVADVKLIDRMVADSRAVALNHTAGLSTPQQVMMTLFSLLSLTEGGDDYKKTAQGIVAARFKSLYQALEIPYTPGPQDALYYTTIDVLEMAKKRHGDEMAAWMVENFEPVDFVLRLAEEKQVVLLPGAGFDAPDWTVRVSLANLDDKAYGEIGLAIKAMVDEYFDQFSRKG